MARKTIEAGLVIGLLLWISAAQAQALTVSPSLGTAGTAVTLTGSQFGTVKGTVWIGSKPCEVVAWNVDKVVCKVLPMPPGDYSLTVRFGWSVPWRTQLSASFTVKSPRVLSPVYRPQFLTAGQPVTVKGEFFGEREGWVWLENLQGKVRLCDVESWKGDEITFVAPEGMTGLCHLKIQNDVAICDESHWATFVKLPAPPPVVGGTYQGPQTHTTAAAAYFNGLLYVFYPTEDDSGDEIHYRIRYEDGSWDGDAYSVKNDSSKGQSKAMLTPLVVKDTLYVFFTGLSGYLDYYYLDNISNTWKGIYSVTGADTTNVDARFAAVYNFTKERIEVYYLKKDTWELYFLYLDLATGKWSTKQLVNSYTGRNPSLSGVFYQTGDGTYVTYLTFSAYNKAYVYHLVDGAVTKTDKDDRWTPDTSQYDAPFLADFGEDRMALMWGKKTSDNLTTDYWSYYYHIFDKATQAWVGSPSCPISNMGNGWSPTGVVHYIKSADSTSKVGYRWYAYGYMIWGEAVGFDDNWIFTGITTEGWWTGVGTPSETRFSDYENDSFATWPILQVVDLPPFVINGSTTDPEFPCASEYDCTRVEIAISQETKDVLEGTLEAGVYFGKEAKKKSPLTFDFSLGASAGMGTETEFKVEQGSGLLRNTEGFVMALYLAPRLTTYQMEWYNLDKEATGVYTYPIRVTGTDILTRNFNPERGPCATCTGVTQPYMDTTQFRVHEGETDMERLGTYPVPLSKYTAVTTTGSWNQYGFSNVTWDASTTSTRTAGGKFTFKVGASFAALRGIGGGVEGSFDVKYSTSTMKGVSAVTYLKNPEPKTATDIGRFDVTGYWMDAVKDSYWIPNHRKGLGDAPWFITYAVKNIGLKY